MYGSGFGNGLNVAPLAAQVRSSLFQKYLSHPAAAAAATPMAASVPATTTATGWWANLSQTEKIALVGGGVLLVGAVAYFVMEGSGGTAKANPRRKRARRRVRRHRRR